MKLYHGSNMVVEKPEVHAGRRALDFGVGFYLTSKRVAFNEFLQSESYQMLLDKTLEIYSMSPLVVFDMWESEKVTGNPRNSVYIRAWS